jgi:N-acetylmuramoyl-L-alanine amidase
MIINFLRFVVIVLLLMVFPALRLGHPAGLIAADGFAESLPRGAGEGPSSLPHSTGKALLTQIRFLSSKTYTRVMVDLSKEVKYETHRLKEDSSKGLPPRIYVDIIGARLATRSKEPIPVQDGLLRQVRVGQFSQDVVRVVLDMNSLREHSLFLLPDPYRLVIDIQGQNGVDPLASVGKGKVAPRTGDEKKPSAAALVGIRKIVLDPGHGGKDPGAIGVGGIAEKDIVLNVAKKLAAKIKQEMGIEVVLTREDDRFVPLEDRTAIANAEDADLFISLHMNASPSAEAKGLETYYLDNTNDEAAMRLAARENGTSRNNISDLQFILSDMTQNMKLEDSITLAHRVHGSLVSRMSKKMGEVKDLGVKKALFYVLVGARMPSVLVEMFFITNKSEGRAMARSSNQNALVEALYQGVKEYHQSMLAMKTL